MKDDVEIIAEFERVKDYLADEEVNAVLQVFHWILDDNTMAPYDYLGLKSGREPVRK